MSVVAMAPIEPGAGVDGPAPEPAAPHSRLPGIFWVGAAIVGAFAVLAVAAGAVAGYRVTELAGDPLEAPSAGHLLGTNAVGQDVASQLFLGARMSLLVALVAGGGAVAIGAAIGILAGWAGGRTDAIVMRAVDLVLVTPTLPLLIILGAYAGPSVAAIAVIIAATSWPPSARIVRAQVLSLRHRAHLQAAVSFGAGAGHMLRRHIVPELGLILAAALVGAMGRAVVLEAGLSFLGLGDPTAASWGRLMRESLSFSALFDLNAWAWWLVPPVTAIALLMLGLAFLGVGIEQRLNPRLARHTTSRRSR